MPETIQITLFDYFADVECFTLKEANELVKDIKKMNVKIPSIRARIYEGIDNGMFERVAKGVYRTVSKDDVQCVLVSGNGRDLSMLEDSSIDAIITDHPYDLKKSHQGGNRHLIDYSTFRYSQKDFDEKCRVLKDGAFLVEFIPEESGENWEYLSNIKYMAKKSGFEYYAKVAWIKDGTVSNMGRKANNSEELLFFSKGKARCLRLNQKKNLDELRKAEIPFSKGISSSETKDLLELFNLPIHYMSGTNGILPTAFVFSPANKNEKIHKAEKPIELYKEVLKYITLEFEWVLDQFSGSHNLAKASLEVNRHSISIELDDKYVQKAIQDLQDKNYEIETIYENDEYDYVQDDEDISVGKSR